MGLLNTSLKRFSDSSNKSSKKIEMLTWALIFFTIILVVMTYVLIRDAKEQASSSNFLSINNQMFSSENTKIIGAIDSQKPILIENKGKSSEYDLQNYLGVLDSLNQAYDRGRILPDDFCEQYSYYIIDAYENKEIQTYLKKIRQNDHDYFYQGFDDLYKVVKNSKNVNCQ